MNNPKDPTDLTLSALVQQTALYGKQQEESAEHLRKLTSALQALVAERAAGSPMAPKASVARLPGQVVKTTVHPLQDAIMAILADGQAHLKIELATQIPGADRSSVHYHCKRLQIRNLVRDVGIGIDGHDTDYVIATEHCPPIPGIDTKAVKVAPKGGPRKAS